MISQVPVSSASLVFTDAFFIMPMFPVSFIIYIALFYGFDYISAEFPNILIQKEPAKNNKRNEILIAEVDIEYFWSLVDKFKTKWGLLNPLLRPGIEKGTENCTNR